MDDIIYQRYRQVACASIIQGVNDYLESDTMDEYSLYKWIEECDYFDYLELDREYFFVKVLNLKKKGVKKINYHG